MASVVYAYKTDPQKYYSVDRLTDEEARLTAIMLRTPAYKKQGFCDIRIMSVDCPLPIATEQHSTRA